jgi:hypothetical protein
MTGWTGLAPRTHRPSDDLTWRVDHPMSEEFESDRDSEGVSEASVVAAIAGTTRSPRAPAPTTTAASTTSAVPATPQAAPADRARASSRCSIRQPANSLDNCACGPPRQPRPNTPAGTFGRMPRSIVRRGNAQTRRSAAIGCDQRSRVIGDARHRSGRDPVVAPVDDRIRPRQLLVSELTVVSLPGPNPGQTVLEDERPLSCRDVRPSPGRSRRLAGRAYRVGPSAAERRRW